MKGLNTILHNLNKEIQKIEMRSMSGLIKSAALVRRDMDETPPMIPVEYGNLRASWFVTPIHTQKGPVVLMGFAAAYAAFVHELVDAHFQRPGAGAKFLEASLKRNAERILTTIQGEAKI